MNASVESVANTIRSGLEVRGLECAAGLRTLFKELSFHVQPGHWVCLTGPNGCGKSTLLRALAGLGHPLAGTVSWLAGPVQHAPLQWHASFVYQGHQSGCKDSLSALENLHWQLTLDGLRCSPSELHTFLDRVGLRRQSRLAHQQLSAGQRRRLGLARLHALDRPLWLLDEPTTALDADGQSLFGELLDAHLQSGGCAVVATHLDLPVSVAPKPLALAQSALS